MSSLKVKSSFFGLLKDKMRFFLLLMRFWTSWGNVIGVLVEGRFMMIGFDCFSLESIDLFRIWNWWLICLLKSAKSFSYSSSAKLFWFRLSWMLRQEREFFTFLLSTLSLSRIWSRSRDSFCRRSSSRHADFPTECCDFETCNSQYLMFFASYLWSLWKFSFPFMNWEVLLFRVFKISGAW